MIRSTEGAFTAAGDLRVLAFSGETAADMAFLLVFFEDFLDSAEELGVLPAKSIADVFMNGAFRYPELSCSTADRFARFGNIPAQHDSPSLRLILQINHLFPVHLLMYMPQVKAVRTTFLHMAVSNISINIRIKKKIPQIILRKELII